MSCCSLIIAIHECTSPFYHIMTEIQHTFLNNAKIYIGHVMQHYSSLQCFMFMHLAVILEGYRIEKSFREQLGMRGSSGIALWQPDGVCGKVSEQSYSRLANVFMGALLAKATTAPTNVMVQEWVRNL